MDNKVSEFGRMHPAVSFIYFAGIIGFSMFVINPVAQGISFICAFSFSAVLKGKRAIKSLLFLAPAILVTALLNPLFNHEGATILTYFPNGNPLTLESVLYGFSAGTMLATVICWFSCLNEIITEDKIIYLFGKALPALSVVLSMVLRFVPRFKNQVKKIVEAQRGIGAIKKEKGFLEKLKNGIKILSAMISWSIENAIDTADSMKSRGYGLSGRTSFSIFSWNRRDVKILIWILFLFMWIISGIVFGGFNFVYFPVIEYRAEIWIAFCVNFGYLLLCSIPIFIEFWEVRKWKQ